jgi:hypothetical protein
VRDLVKKLIIGIALLITPSAFAEDYKVLVLPDNIVTENIALDSFIYNASAEFFADDIVTLLNETDYISSPTVSEIRQLYKEDPSAMIPAKNLTNKFKTTYNVDYVALKKLANKADSKYVLLMTSHVDAENYILRRTPWDILNIPGASVIDPAYKISTCAVLVDTENNSKLWSDTFYKTISVCENRIITRGASPQTEQLQKIKDYSKYISPQIAQKVQYAVLPEDKYNKESKQIEYDLGNIDNIFTKKYRHLGQQTGVLYGQKKKEYKNFVEKRKNADEAKKLKKLEQKEAELRSKLEVKATPVYDEKNINNNTNKNEDNGIKDTVFKKESKELQYPELIKIEIKKKKKNNLFGEFQPNQPELRSYN